MFGFGKKEGAMVVAAVAIAVVPMLIAMAYIPQLADQVAMKFAANGEVARWGSKYELLMAPALAVALGIGNVVIGLHRAQRIAKSDPVMARVAFGRYVRNALVLGVVLLVATIYLFHAAITGAGTGF